MLLTCREMDGARAAASQLLGKGGAIVDIDQLIV